MVIEMHGRGDCPQKKKKLHVGTWLSAGEVWSMLSKKQGWLKAEKKTSALSLGKSHCINVSYLYLICISPDRFHQGPYLRVPLSLIMNNIYLWKNLKRWYNGHTDNGCGNSKAEKIIAQLHSHHIHLFVINMHVLLYTNVFLRILSFF